MTRVKYRIVAVKRRTGEVVSGTTTWDGLSDLLAVTTDTGETAYVSSLDTWTTFEAVTA